MTTIRTRADIDPATAMSTVRASVESRGYVWDGSAPLDARASEDAPIADAELAVSQRLRVRVRAEVGSVRIDQETVGAAMTGAGASAGAGPWLMMKLGTRFRKLVKAVRRDLEAAGIAGA